MQIKLNKYLFDYLKNSLLDKQNTLKWNVIQNNSSIIIEIENNVADEIRDFAIDKQSLKGFDINYELTNEGKILEELIDAFYVK